MIKYKVIFTYDNDEIIETRYEGDDKVQAELTYYEEKLNLLKLGGDDCCDVKLIVEEN